ncbi:MAG TPA: Uma2 family endonuclease [Candidatus Angelobacter sp.]|jgi:Uma2 family endonuclease|nr:Uma2 family endonuclease [Candidatus Angelobacter sp.]
MKNFFNFQKNQGNALNWTGGALIVEPSPTYRHNRIRQRIARHLEDVVQRNQLGGVTAEQDFRLASDVVRNPDVAFIATEPLC